MTDSHLTVTINLPETKTISNQLYVLCKCKEFYLRLSTVLRCSVFAEQHCLLRTYTTLILKKLGRRGKHK